MAKIKYLSDLDNYLKKDKQKLYKKEQQEILKVYNRAFDNMMKEYKANSHKKNATQIARIAYCKQLYDEIDKIMKEYNMEVSSNILNAHISSLMKDIDYYKNTELIEEIKKKANIVNREVVEQMIKGRIYKDGQGISNRLWKSVSSSGDKIEEAITSMIAQGKGATEIARNLTQFAKQGHKTWDRAKIKEKLGSAYAGKYGAGGLDYEALRLARTTLNHQAQLTQMNTHKVNPYAQKLKWHSVHQSGRTCALCEEREGKIFDVKDCPFDHPNGLCHLENIFCIDGKEVDRKQMAEDIGKWIRGEENSGTMDKIPEYKKLSKNPKPKTSKGKSKTANNKANNKKEPKKNYKQYDYLTSMDIPEENNFLKMLTKEEKNALKKYTKDEWFSDINDILRGNHLEGLTAKEIKAIEKKTKKTIEQISSALKKGIAHTDMKVFRGTSPSIFNNILDKELIEKINNNKIDAKELNKRLKGLIIKDNAFMSTTVAPDSPYIGDFNFGIFMEIKVDKGATGGGYIAPISTHSGEREWLFDKGTQLQIEKITWDEEKQYYKLDCRYIDPKTLGGKQ